MNQEVKERQYIMLLDNIVSRINDDIDIIFDAFNKKDFEQNIIDNICSIIRLHKTNVENDFYCFI